MEDILKIVQALEDSGLLLEGVSETIKNEAKEQKGGFLSMLLGTLGTRLLGDRLAGKGIGSKEQDMVLRNLKKAKDFYFYFITSPSFN